MIDLDACALLKIIIMEKFMQRLKVLICLNIAKKFKNIFFPKKMMDLAACALLKIIIIEKIMTRLTVLICINIEKNVKINFLS